MPRMDKLSRYCTTVAQKNGNTVITYHSTAIVEFDSENIILRTGGYKTVTTKRKMNQTAAEFDLPFGVAQRNGEWFVIVRSKDGLSRVEYPFSGDVIQLDRESGIPQAHA